MGGFRGSIRRGAGALSQAAADGGGGWRASGHVRPAFPAIDRALRRRGSGGIARSSAGQAIAAAGAPEGELSRMRRLYQELYGDFTMKHFHEQLQKRHGYKARLHRDAACAAGGGSGAQDQARRAAPQEARAPAAAGQAAVPGWLDPSLDTRLRSRSRPRRNPRRRHRGDLFGHSRGAGRHGLELPRASAGRSRKRACFAPSTPIGDRTTSTRPRPAARSTRPSSPKSAARFSSWASPIPHPTRRRPAAAWNGSSGPCRAGCRPNSA